MKKLSKKAWCGIALLLLVVIGCLWYARPLSILEIEPDLNPDIIAFDLTRNGGGGDVESRHLRFERGDDGFDEWAAVLSATKFCRPPTNLLFTAFPFLADIGSKTYTLDGYDYQIYIAMSNADSDEWLAALDYQFGEWSYHTHPDYSLSLPLYAPAEFDGKILGDALWAIAENG